VPPEDSDLTIRPITGPDELELFSTLPYRLNEELAGDLRDGHRQPAWLWMALRGVHLVARAIRAPHLDSRSWTRRLSSSLRPMAAG
jgi:hypothetical protein